MFLQGGIFIVIYADVLFIINFFITFLLLETASKAGKRKPKTYRVVIASALGGLYSLIILVNSIPIYIMIISKIIFAAVLILISNGFVRLKSYLSMLLIFLFTNFVFLGIIAGIQMLFHSDRISINNGEIYFDVNAKQLLFSALISYAASCLIIRIYNKKISSGDIYSVIIENNSKSVSLFALTDSGNRLREPFSDSPVIVVRADLVEGLFDESRARLVPATTVNSKTYLKAYKPECLKIKTKKGYERVENVYVALSDEIDSKAFSAVFNPEIISV